MSKIDHCEFPEKRRYAKGLPNGKSDICKLIIPGKNGYSKAEVADCVKACEKDDECDGVNVVPLQKPNGIRF